jgi:hypothetical protein
VGIQLQAVTCINFRARESFNALARQASGTLKVRLGFCALATKLVMISVTLISGHSNWPAPMGGTEKNRLFVYCCSRDCFFETFSQIYPGMHENSNVFRTKIGTSLPSRI